jgi:hypothetical protein
MSPTTKTAESEPLRAEAPRPPPSRRARLGGEAGQEDPDRALDDVVDQPRTA